MQVKKFTFQQTEKVLNDRIVQTVIFPTHALQGGVAGWSLFPDLPSDSSKWSETLDVDFEGHQMFQEFLSGLEYFSGSFLAQLCFVPTERPTETGKVLLTEKVELTCVKAVPAFL